MHRHRIALADIHARLPARRVRPYGDERAPGGSDPATEWKALTSSAAAGSSCGIIVGSRLASMSWPILGSTH